MTDYTPQQFVDKWNCAELKESAVFQEYSGEGKAIPNRPGSGRFRAPVGRAALRDPAGRV
jgi:hypothetical protein